MMQVGLVRLPLAMLSIPHMIVIFVVILVVFGPEKLPELARGLGKLMAEFRKASTDFRSAFDEEMREMERQVRDAEYRKRAQAAAITVEPPALPEASGIQENSIAGPVLAPPDAETVPRAVAGGEVLPPSESEAAPEETTHDHQQPA